METNTLVDIFFTSISYDVERHVMFKRGATWQVISSRQLYGYVVALARVLKQWGIHKGDRVAILGENRPEWMIADFACVTSGIVDVPIYATLTADQTLYLLQNSRARVHYVSTLHRLRKVQSSKAQTSLEKTFVVDDVSEANVIPMWSLIKVASIDDDCKFNQAIRKIQAEIS